MRENETEGGSDEKKELESLEMPFQQMHELLG